MEEVHDEVQVNQVVVKALLVQFQQLLFFIVALCGAVPIRRRPTGTAHLSGNPRQRQEGRFKLSAPLQQRSCVVESQNK